jgi:hypothetical protein
MAVFSALAGCSGADPRFPPADLVDSVDRYFPALHVRDQDDEALNRNLHWYTLVEMLERSQEPPLLSVARDGEAFYRFLWVGCWGESLLVRVASSKQGRSVEARGAGLPANVRRALSDGEWGEFSGLLRKSSWDSMNVRDGISGLDGGYWIVEGVQGGRYRYVERWTPNPGPYLDLCLFMVSLSSTTFEPY